MNKFTKIQHGFMEHPKNKHCSHTKKCNIHGHHGCFYICPYYGREMKNKIKKLANKWNKNPTWRTVTNELLHERRE